MSSKYDVVKLKVMVEDEHYYFLSRYLLSKMLMFCRVPANAAIKISLQVKKHFVDGKQLCVAQAELLHVVRTTMAAHGYDESHSVLLNVLMRFYEERVPLVVLIGGTGCTGKTSLAQQLSARLNCNTTVNTDYLLDMLDAADDLLDDDYSSVREELALLVQSPYSFDDVNSATLMDRCVSDFWEHRCRRVQSALCAEVEKALSEGKVLVAEGTFLDLALYQPYFSSALQREREGIVLGFYLHCPQEEQRVEILCAGGGARATGFFADMAPLFDAGDDQDNLLRVCEVVERRHSEAVHLAFPSGSPTTALTTTDEGEIVLAEGATSTATSLFHVDVPQLVDLPVVADALHDIILDRILKELIRRGRLDEDIYHTINREA